MSTLPLVSYPLSVTLVDDDALFLQATAGLLKKNYQLTEFGNPHEALNFFKSYAALLPSVKTLRGCTDHETYDVAGSLPVDLDLEALKNLREQPERFDEIGVLILDYNMPGMNGVELCRQLKSLPMKKILLTGEADDQLAINAFNERVIDAFIRKDSPTLAQDVNFYMNILMQQYFVDNTKQLLQHLETDNLLPASDPVFVNFFKEWCRTQEIKEFYLIDQNANFVLIDSLGRKNYFVTHTERTLENFTDLHADNEDANSFVEAVKSREKIPFFGESNESWEVEVKEWDKYFHTPQVINGREKYYYSFHQAV